MVIQDLNFVNLIRGSSVNFTWMPCPGLFTSKDFLSRFSLSNTYHSSYSLLICLKDPVYNNSSSFSPRSKKPVWFSIPSIFAYPKMFRQFLQLLITKAYKSAEKCLRLEFMLNLPDLGLQTIPASFYSKILSILFSMKSPLTEGTPKMNEKASLTVADFSSNRSSYLKKYTGTCFFCAYSIQFLQNQSHILIPNLTNCSHSVLNSTVKSLAQLQDQVAVMESQNSETSTSNGFLTRTIDLLIVQGEVEGQM